MLRHYYTQLERSRTIHREEWLLLESPLPSEQRALIERLAVGDSVKLNNGDELFYAIVMAIDGDRVIGRVENFLIHERPYSYGDRIEFRRQYVWFVRDAVGQATLAAALEQQEAARPGSLVQHEHYKITPIPATVVQ
jgi:hypothetical protein